MSRIAAITNFLFLGGVADVKRGNFLRDNGINLIINAAKELPDYHCHGIETHRVKISDIPSAKIEQYFDKISDLIEKRRQRGHKVVVHCVAGVSRSVTLVLAYLMKYQKLSLAEAHALVKSKRSTIRPNNGFWMQLIDYEKKLFNKTTVAMVPTHLGMVPSVYEPEIRSMV